VAIHRGGGLLDPRAVRLGKKGRHPGAVPFCVDGYEIDGGTDVTGKPRIEDSETLICYLWAKDPEREKARPTDENIRNLRALGYLE
jgi:hypothetical protein